jgi:hypothetical protein
LDAALLLGAGCMFYDRPGPLGLALRFLLSFVFMGVLALFLSWHWAELALGVLYATALSYWINIVERFLGSP